jgi:apoptosis-inducing factor 2
MKKIVIVGGGFTGTFVAKELEEDFDVTLIDAKDYFEFTPSVLKVIVHPQFIKKVQVRHKHYLHKGKCVMDKVVKFDEKCVKLEKGKDIEYDYLVLAVGSSYNSKIKQDNVILASRADTLKETHKKLVKAQDIVVIGGGLVGVELAAEIIEKYPNKKVTILHSRENLIQRNSSKAQRYAKKFFEERKVELVLKDRMVEVTPNEVLTQSGKKIKADLTFLCVGISPNSQIIEKSCPQSLSKKGAVMVDEFLQVKNCPNVFSGGDITDIKEEKTAQHAQAHAKIIIQNIRSLEKKEDLQKYVSKSTPMIISLGEHHGIMEIKGKTVTGILPGILKKYPEWRTMHKLK